MTKMGSILAGAVRKRDEPGTMAAMADKHICYQEAVQCPKKEVKNLQNIYLELRNANRSFERKNPSILREDFCGTAILCKAWADSGVEKEAIGVDLDPAVLRYGREHYAHDRVQLFHCNVLSMKCDTKADILVALNYGVCYFHSRQVLMEYLRKCLEATADDGVFICDLFGGVSATQACQFRRKCSNFTYTFDQSRCNPLTNICRCTINFNFGDGSALKNCFTYEFRVWTLVELREAVLEAGFANCHVWIAETVKDGSDDTSADFVRVKDDRHQLNPSSSWNAYIVATKF